MGSRDGRGAACESRMQIIQSKGTLQKHSFKKYKTDSTLVQVSEEGRAHVN
jgi:hypothetical protein